MDAFHQILLDPKTYPEKTTHVDFKETHISKVYLTDSYAYKFKKPLNLGFLDFSNIKKRQHYCLEEVRLNRRFSPKIYLGVVELFKHQNNLSLGHGPGKIIDYAVKMQRLPEQLMLDQMIAADEPGLASEMPRLAEALYNALENAEKCTNEPQRNAETVKRNWNENFLQTKDAVGSSLMAKAHKLMQKATEQDLTELQGLMTKREAKGFVRDGHGDLHTANICMTDPVCIYDCIEFNRRFRVADVVADLAFLIMDLEFRARRDLGEKLLASYQGWSIDHDLNRLLPFYKRYRAWTRGKVNSILAGEMNATSKARDDAGQMASRYFNLALGSLLSPTLFITTGLMGVGKSSLSRNLSCIIGAHHLRSDVIRKELYNIPEEQMHFDSFGSGLYNNDKTERTYEELFKRAQDLLVMNQHVVVDASFSRQLERRRFLEMAFNKGFPAILLHVYCADEIALQRLNRRGKDASDGRKEIYFDQKTSFEPIGPRDNPVGIDTSNSIDYNVQSILCQALNDRE